ncbi:MAG: hypothetical protein MJY74_07995, partial [Bacteroidaceae bacterium]|nr:hypothetical protein [Bacteroidaceae bacterium]
MNFIVLIEFYYSFDSNPCKEFIHIATVCKNNIISSRYKKQQQKSLHYTSALRLTPPLRGAPLHVEMHLAMKPPPDGLVSGVRTATANQPSQIGGKTRRLAAKNASTCAKTAQNAKGEMNLAMKPPPDGLVSGVRT